MKENPYLKTTPEHYLTGRIALNIFAHANGVNHPEANSDWHQVGLGDLQSIEKWQAGIGKPSTLHILNSKGVVEAQDAFKDQGLVERDSNTPVYVANWARATFDDLYNVLKNNGSIRSIVIDDYFGTPASKIDFYEYIFAALPKLREELTQEQLGQLYQFMVNNPIGDD